MKMMRLVSLLLLSLPLFAQDYDVLIKNGRVVDGSGNPWFYADIGIKADRITLVGFAPANATAKRTTMPKASSSLPASLTCSTSLKITCSSIGRRSAN